METKDVLRSLAALSQESRLAIFRLLVEQGPSGLPAGQIADRLDLPAATSSFHLKELATAGLITARQESRFIYYAADFDAMNGVIAYLTDNCCQGRGVCVAECAPQCLPQPTSTRRTTSPPHSQPSKRMQRRKA
jgi:ArsR family transcriptional regulator, arsenate/arsenite/antimonite-responsive transcriptional repressor